jgi:hypothetical protein
MRGGGPGGAGGAGGGINFLHPFLFFLLLFGGYYRKKIYLCHIIFLRDTNTATEMILNAEKYRPVHEWQPGSSSLTEAGGMKELGFFMPVNLFILSILLLSLQISCHRPPKGGLNHTLLPEKQEAYSYLIFH